MKTKTQGTTPTKPDKTDIEIMQSDQQSYNMLIDAIVQNKRLHWRIVARWLDMHSKYLVDREETDREFARKYPKLAKKLQSIEG